MTDDDFFEGGGQGSERSPAQSGVKIPAGLRVSSYAPNGLPLDQWKRYMLPHPDTGKWKGWQRASTFAKYGSETHGLTEWAQRAVAVGMSRKPTLISLVASMEPGEGVETVLDDDRHKPELKKVVERAKEAAGALDRGDLGTSLHRFSETWDSTGKMPPYVPKHNRDDVVAYADVVRRLGLVFRDEWAERTIVNPTYDTAGTFDRIVELSADLRCKFEGKEIILPAGARYVYDLKTGKETSIVYQWGEIGVQILQYATADGMFNMDTSRYDLMPTGLRTAIGLVLRAPSGTGQAWLEAVNLVAARDRADLALRIRNMQKADASQRKVPGVLRHPVDVA